MKAAMYRQALSLHQKRKQKKPNWNTDELVYTGNVELETGISLISFNSNEYSSRTISDPKSLSKYLIPGNVNWIAVKGFANTESIATIGQELGMHRLDVQDILLTQHISKIELYDETTLFVISLFSYPQEQGILKQEHLGFLLTKNCVVSFQESNSPIFKELIEIIGIENSRIRRKGNDYFFCQLINTVLNHSITTVAHMEEELSLLEDELMDQETSKDFLKRLQANRHIYETLKKAVFPLKEDFKELLFNENELVREDSMIYLNDLQDRLEFILESLDTARENIASLQELYFANNDLRMNEIMKRLTVVATIFIPLTFVVGVWGMNFRFMPELEWKYGYFIAWFILIITGLLCWIFIKRRKWY